MKRISPISTKNIRRRISIARSFFSILSGPGRPLPGGMDGSATAGAGPCRRRAVLHAVQLLPSCTLSRWDKSGMRKESPGKPIACRYGGWSARVAFFDHPPHFALDLGELRFQRRAARIDHDVPLRREFGPVQPEGFAKTALDSISDHGFADRARHCEAQTGPTFPRGGVQGRDFARPAKGGEQRTGDAESVIIDKPEIGGAQNPGGPGKVERPALWFNPRFSPTVWVRRRGLRGRLFHRSRSACGGREPGAAPAPPGHPCSSFSREIRASWRAYDCSVETFSWASFLLGNYGILPGSLGTTRGAQCPPRRRTRGSGSLRSTVFSIAEAAGV